MKKYEYMIRLKINVSDVQPPFTVVWHEESERETTYMYPSGTKLVHNPLTDTTANVPVFSAAPGEYYVLSDDAYCLL